MFQGLENFQNIDENGQPVANQGNVPSGNDLKQALPKIVFNKEDYKNTGSDNKDKLECLICMCEFANGDSLTLL